MKITFKEIQNTFAALIQEKKSREEIAYWAEKVEKAYQKEQLEFEPQEKEELILMGIFYLSGVHLKLKDDEYLLSIEDLIEYQKENGF